MLGNGPQTRGAHHQDVGEGAYMHAELTVENLEAADALHRLQPAIDRRLAFSGLNLDAHNRPGQEVRQVLGHANGSGPRPAAAVRRGKGLVQVDVQDVEAQVAGAANAEQRVEVGAVAVDQARSEESR